MEGGSTHLRSQDALELGVGSPPPQDAATENTRSNGKRKPAAMGNLVQIGCISTTGELLDTCQGQLLGYRRSMSQCSLCRDGVDTLLATQTGQLQTGSNVCYL